MNINYSVSPDVNQEIVTLTYHGPDFSDLPCPYNGINIWTLQVARRCAKSGLSREAAERQIYKLAEGARRLLKRQEVQRSLDRAYSEEPLFGTVDKKPIVVVNHELIASLTKDGPGLRDLNELSPSKWADDASHTAEVLQILYRPDALINAGRITESAGVTRPLRRWLIGNRLEGQQFIIPNAMSRLCGITKDGRHSMKSNDNTGPRMYFVCDFDNGTKDDHAAIIHHLSRYMPLVMAVDSGGKSLHGWFRTYQASEIRIKRFIDYAVSLGADPAMRTVSQYCRMPDAIRDNGNRQTVIYFNRKVAVNGI